MPTKKPAARRTHPGPPLRLEYRSPAELAENPANWRRHPKAQVAALAGVIAEVGWAGACLYNERTKRLIDGHARRKLALDRGDALVPVIVGRWTEAQERLILATLDPLAAMAEADSAALSALLGHLEPASAAVAEVLAGLAASAGAAVRSAVDDPGGGGDAFDPTPAPADEPTRAKPGDLWVLGPHRLLVGDCTDPANVARLFAGAVPPLMVTDPPYGVEYDPTWRHRAGANTSKRDGKVLNDDRADWTAAWRLFPGAVAYVWHGALHGRTVFDSLAAAGFAVRAQLVWVKPRLVLSRGHYHWKHEPALVAGRGDPDPDPAVEAELAYYAVRQGSSAEWRGGRKQTTVWEVGFAGEDKTFHGTQKPVECMARPMRHHGPEGGAVYDPFLGSGTTLIAAHRLGRACLGMELDPRYADVIIRRAEAEGLTAKREPVRGRKTCP